MKHYRKQIHIRMIHVIATVIIVIGGMLLWQELDASVKISNPTQMESLSLQSMKKGDYVTGKVTYLSGKYMETLGENQFNGCSIVYSSLFFQTLNYYTVPINHGTQYLSLLLSDKQADLFEHMTDVEDTEISVPVTGKIVKLPTEINYEWNKQIFDVKTDTEVEQVLSPVYGIRMVNVDEVQNEWKKGLSILFTGMLLLTLFGNLKTVVSVVQETPQPVVTPQTQPGRLSPQMVEIVIAGKKKERELLKQQYGQYIRQFVIYLILSVVIFYYAFQIHGLLIWLAAVVIAFLCLRNLWLLFVNGKSRMGRIVNRIFDMDSDTEKMELLQAQIDAIRYLNSK